eukprot:454172-Pyramimonas_sp.AAC.1
MRCPSVDDPVEGTLGGGRGGGEDEDEEEKASWGPLALSAPRPAPLRAPPLQLRAQHGQAAPAPL